MDYDLTVIGSGPGGYVAAIRAAQLGLKTLVIEKDQTFGGTCLNVGCIPSKALLQSSHLYHQSESFEKHGLAVKEITVNLAKMQDRKKNVVNSLTEGIAFLFKKNKVDSLKGTASFKDPHTLRIKDEKEREVSSKYIIIATGSEPISLPFLPLDEKEIVSSTGALAFEKIPKSLLIIGAGIIGLELGSVWARLGTTVEVVELLPQIAPTMDLQLSTAMQKQLSSLMTFHLSHQVIKAEKKKGSIQVIAQDGSKQEKSFEAEKVLVAIGRKPYTEGLALDKVGIALDEKKRIITDDCFRVDNHSHIFAIGDVIEGPMLAHKASDEGHAVAEFIAGHKPKIHYIAIPNVAYIHPEAASVGLTEEKAKELKIDYVKASLPMKGNPRARCTDETEGIVKVIARKETGQIIGVHLYCAGADELIQEAALAVQKKCTAKEIALLSHAHPTIAEIIKEACAIIGGCAVHS
jgi:dihydrolipoamide dehydrogenase